MSNSSRLLCDLTQSWSEVGGGVGTYLRRKREYILSHTPHRHLLIIPGAEDRISVERGGRATTVTIASRHVPGSPNYRLLLRNRAVAATFDEHQPDLVECQDAYNLPWAAIGYRRRAPATPLVAAYMTDFPTTYVDRPVRKLVGGGVASALSKLAYRYCGHLYRRFDSVFALSENGGATKLRSYGVEDVQIVPLGVEIGHFSPANRDLGLRSSLGVGPNQPLLIYVGRLDGEKRARVVVDAYRKLPESLGAKLVLLGEGPVREEVEALDHPGIIAPGFVRGRDELGRWLASADIYVSGMRDETFGVSIVEAQASGLPVVGVAAGAMIDRVTEETGLLGPVDDSTAMARNILEVWASDRPAMARAAREVAHRYTWDHSFEALFGRVYPLAFSRRRQQLVALQPSRELREQT